MGMGINIPMKQLPLQTHIIGCVKITITGNTQSKRMDETPDGRIQSIAKCVCIESSILNKSTTFFASNHNDD